MACLSLPDSQQKAQTDRLSAAGSDGFVCAFFLARQPDGVSLMHPDG